MSEQQTERKLLNEDPDKVLAAICYVLCLADSENYLPTQYDIVKAIFLADRQHLNEWGRPITFDNYKAMLHGPVPSLTYDLLKANALRMRRVHLNELPWRRSAGEKGKFHYFAPQIEKYQDFLSESDTEALNHGYRLVRKLGFGQIRRLTHEDPAYIAAWKDGEGAAFDMNLALLFDEPDPERADYLQEMSGYVRAG